MADFFDPFDAPKGNESAQFFDPFDAPAAPAPAAKKQNKGILSDIGGAFVGGAKSAGQAVAATGNVYTGNEQALIDKAKSEKLAQEDKPEALRRFNEAVQANAKPLGEDPGLWDSIKAVGGAVLEQPKGAGLAIVEQLPNSAPAMAGGLAGMKAGAMAGTAVAPGVGTTIGGILGGVAGMFLGNTAIETGHKAIEAAHDGSVTPDEMAKVRKEGAAKSGVITGVDALTLGLSKGITNAGARAVESATRKTLADAGVNVADKAALLAARQSPEISSAVRAAQETALASANTLGKRAAAGGAALGLETVGEGVGEYFGELAATGKANMVDAVLESVLSLGQSSAEVAWGAARNKKGEGAGLWDIAGGKYAETKSAEIAGLLPAPTYTGTPGEQIIANDAERQAAIDAADKNAAELYAARDEFERKLRQAVTITNEPAPLQERIDEMLRVDTSKLSGIARTNYEKALEAAFNEPIGIRHDKDQREVPFTIGEYLDAQVALEDAVRNREKSGRAVAESGTRLQQLAEEEATQQPDIPAPIRGIMPEIPVVGPLSKAANAAVQSGAHAATAMQQAQQQAVAGPPAATAGGSRPAPAAQQPADSPLTAVATQAAAPRAQTVQLQGAASSPPAIAGGITAPVRKPAVQVKPVEPKPAEKKGLSVGSTPNAAEPITVRGGVVYIGDYPAQNFDTGEDVTVPEGAAQMQIANALRKAGAISNKQRIFGLGESAADQNTIKKSEPAAATVSKAETVAEKAPIKSAVEQSAIENAVVSTSLSPESASAIRIDRIVASQPNPADKARMRGFYDEMLGLPSRTSEFNKLLVVSYEQGRKRGKDRRALLKGRPWYEVEKNRDGGKWIWSIYQEGMFKRSGEAKSEKEADRSVDIARVELTEKSVSQQKTDFAQEAKQDKTTESTQAAPQHIEAGQSEPATKAVVAESLATGAENSSLSISEQKAYLLKRIDAAIAEAPTAEEKSAWNKVEQRIDLTNNMHVEDTIGYRMFDVPGDGKFKILNLKEALQRFRERVETNPGFKKPVKQREQTTPEWQRVGRSGTEGTIRDLLDDGDVTAAYEYAKQIGKPMVFGDGRDGPIAYTDARPFEIEGFDDFPMVSARTFTGNSDTWAVIHPDSGLAIVSGEKTRAKAEAETRKKVGALRPDSRDLMKQKMGATKGAQNTLAERWLAGAEEAEKKAQASAEQENRTARLTHSGLFNNPNWKRGEESAKPVAQKPEAPKAEAKEPAVDKTNESPEKIAESLDAAKIKAGYAHRAIGGLGSKVEMERKWFADALKKIRDYLSPFARNDQQKTELEYSLAKFADDYKERRYGVLEVGSSVVSSAVAGRNNFNSTQAGRRGNALDRAEADFNAWLEARQEAIKAELLRLRTNEERQADADSAEEKRIKKAVSAIVSDLATAGAIDQGKMPGMERASFLAGAVRKIENLHNDGDTESLRRVFAQIRQYNDTNKKPLFSERHSVWKFEPEPVNAEVADEVQEESAPAIPEGYKKVTEYYRDGQMIDGYAPFAEGERVRLKSGGGNAGVVESFVGAGPAFPRAMVRFDNGSTIGVSWSEVEAEPKAETKHERHFRNVDALNPLTAPVEDGDWFRIGGQEWQARNGYTGRGWSLIDADKKTHPTINNIEANADLIREIVAADGAVEAAAEKELRTFSEGSTDGMKSPLAVTYILRDKSDSFFEKLRGFDSPQAKFDYLQKAKGDLQIPMEIGKSKRFGDQVDLNRALRDGKQFAHFSLAPRRGYVLATLTIDLNGDAAEATATRELNVGDAARLMNIDVVLAKKETADGVRYELFNAAAMKDGRAVLRRTDIDSGNVIGIRTYNDYDQAEKEVADAVRVADQAQEAQKREAWHTDLPAEGLPLVKDQGRLGGYERVPNVVAADAWDAITQVQRTNLLPLYAYYLPAANGRNGIARLFPDDQVPPAPWKLLNGEVVRQGGVTREHGISKLAMWLRSAPILASEEAAKPDSTERSAPTPPKTSYSGPADVSSRAGQMELANRAGTIAALKAMNGQLRELAPGKSLSDNEIENAGDLDVLRDQLSSALVEAGRKKKTRGAPKTETVGDMAQSFAKAGYTRGVLPMNRTEMRIGLNLDSPELDQRFEVVINRKGGEWRVSEVEVPELRSEGMVEAMQQFRADLAALNDGRWPEAKDDVDKAAEPATADSIGWDAMPIEQREAIAVRAGWSAGKDSHITAMGRRIAARAWAEHPDHTRGTLIRFAEVETQKEEASPAESKPASLIDQHAAAMDKLRDGTLSVEELKAAFALVRDNRAAIEEELSKRKKDELLRAGGMMFASQYKSDTKPEIVKGLYARMLDDFIMGSSISYALGGGTDWVNTKMKAIQARVDAATPEKLAEYAASIQKARDERKQASEQVKQAIADPKTLDDFRMYLRAKLSEGMTMQDARLSLTPEQRIQYDTLEAEASRKNRVERKEAAATDVRAAAKITDGQVVETKHTKTGEPLFVVKAAERVERDVYNQWNASAKRLGGWYSSFRGAGAVPGFQFKTREAADAFLQYIGGDATAAKEVVQERRDEFADDRSQSAVERLTEMADKLEERADESLGRERKANTDRRARFAAAAEAAANGEKALAKTMRNIAQAIEGGAAKFLDRVRQKAQVEMLRSTLGQAKYNELREKYPSYSDREKHRGEPPTAETADYARWPTFTADRGDLARLGRELLQIDGAKQLGQKILKVADDVTEAYQKFAKENLHKVSIFSKAREGSETKEPAVFRTADAAEAAIARSGFKGKATTISFKRGEHLVIMGPEMAKEAGFWHGDTDARFVLSPDLGEEIVAKNKAFGKRNRISMPYVFDSVSAERARWRAMGIETPAEMRSALREYVGLREAPAEEDRIKKMERAMVGRKNDGLDFFPTPAETAQALIDAAELEEGMAVLEPSAGMGHIAEQIREAGVEPDVIEFASDRRELLEAKGFNVVGNDFIELSSRGFTYGDVFSLPDGRRGVMRGSGGMGSGRVGFQPLDANGQPDARNFEWVDREDLTGVEKRGTESGYDRIIMNPPFSNRRDAEHVQHAYSLLRPGGRIVAIMGEGVFFGQDKKAQAFRDWLDSVGGTSEKLAEGTFMDPSLPVNTATNARMVVINKPESETAGDGTKARQGDGEVHEGLGNIAEDFSTDEAEQFAADVLAELSFEDTAFRYPVSPSKTLEGNLTAALPGVEFMGEDTRPDEREESGADRRYVFAMPQRDQRLFYVYEKGNEVWFDVSRLLPGDQGSALYHGVANYALNSGKVFVGDPHGLSEDAIVRRTAAMLSSAMRFGTTVHIDASPEQIKGVPEKGIAPLDWRGSDLDKTKALIHTFVENLRKSHPSIDNYEYDFNTLQFRSKADDQRGLRGSGGRVVGREAVGGMDGGREGGKQGAPRAGSATLRRGIFLSSLLDAESGQRPGILEQVLRRAGEFVTRGGLDGVFNRRGRDNITTADKAIYGMSAEGKSAADILKFIASASRNPFNRQLAKLLLKTGVAPKITVGDAKGWKFNAGNDKTYAAAYSPKTNTVALFRPAAAERNVLHELMHAATLKALARKGLAAGQMNALFAHVKKSGALKGMYGMSDVDEFVAEAFTNPKFQEALKKVAAPKGGNKLSSAWRWFVRVVRGILGLPSNDESALSAALEIGIGVMRENMRLSDSRRPAQETLLNMPAVSARFRIDGAFAAVRARAMDAYKVLQQETQDKGYAAVTTDGKRVKFSSAGFKKVASHGADRRILAATANAKSLLESAMPLYSEDPQDKEQGVRKYHYYGTKANFGLGGDALVMMTVRETTNGEWIYDADLTSVETAKAAYSAALAGRTKTGAGETERAAPKGRLLNWIAGVNGGERVRYNEQGGLPDSIMVDGISRPTQNSSGQPIHYTEEGIRNFWRWMDGTNEQRLGRLEQAAGEGADRRGLNQPSQRNAPDSLRRLFDDTGRPRPFYHGTSASFDAFDLDHEGRLDQGWLGRGVYLSDAPELANSYSNIKEMKQGGSPSVMPLYVALHNPLMATLEIKNRFKNMPKSKVDEWTRRAVAAGHDGVILDFGNGMLEVVAFNASAVKSASGNLGTFDANDPDIRFNVADDAFSVAEPSKMDNVIYAMQDKHIDTKRVVQAIRATGQKIADQINPYLQEELFHGRAAKGVKDFLDFELRPLLEDMQARKVDMGDFEEYLWNRHAEERNRQIAKVNPDMKDGGSGIKTADARAYLAGLSAEQRQNFEALAAHIDQINAGSRQILIESGLEKAETIAAWEGAYQHYVPLQREDVDSGHVGTGKGFSVRGSATKRAMGSGRKVVDIIGNLTMQRERNIVRAEKNRVSNALLGLAVQNPNPEFWQVDQAPKERVVEEKAIYTVKDAEGNETEFTRMADAEKFARSLPDADIEQTWGDRVTERVIPGFSTRDNVILTRINGQDHYVVFNERNDRAMRMAQSLKNLDTDNLGRVLSVVGKATRYLASINTQYNPVFGVINLIRDAQGSLLNLSSTPLAGEQKRVLGYTVDALRGIYADIRAHRAGKVPSSNWAKLFEEFQREGGQTGYRDQYANAEDRAEAVRGELAQFKEGKAKQLARGVFGWLSDYNETMENAVRLATYKAATEKGMSKQQAASLAKNITVNFNRKGQMATQVGALYAFFNASVQGTARIAETLFEKNGGDIKASKLSKTGKKILAGGIMLGSMQALLLAAAGFDDDEPPEFVRERNLILPIGDGKYLTLAMPLGFHVLPGIGRIATEFVLSGGKDPAKRAADFFGMFLEAFNPVGSAGFSLQTITPSVVDPFAALAENKDFTGREIYREDFNSLNPQPGHARAKDVATVWSRYISEALNFITGGSEFRPGLASVSPDALDYLVAQAFGGVGREANKIAQTYSATTSGEELPLYKIPLVGRFIGDTEGQSGQSSKFYDAIKQINMHESEYKGLMKSGRAAEAREYAQENPAVRLMMAGNHAENQVRKLRSMKRDLVEKDAPKDQVRAIDDRISETMRKFNERASSVL